MRVVKSNGGESDEPVPSIVMSWSFKFASTFWIPLSWCNDPEMSFTQLSQDIGTAKSVCLNVNVCTRDMSPQPEAWN